MTTTDTLVLPPPAPSPPVRRPDRLRQLGIDTGYLLAGLPVGVVAFVVVLTGPDRRGSPNTTIARTLVVTPGAVGKHTQHVFAELPPTRTSTAGCSRRRPACAG